MTRDLTKLQAVRDYCVMAVYPYNRSELPDGWRVDGDRMQSLASAIGATVAIKEGAGPVLWEPRSAMAAVVMRNEEKKEIVLAFGGTTAGESAHPTPFGRMMPGSNFASTMRQWRANFRAALGYCPGSYRDAAKVTLALQEQLGSDKSLEGYTLHLTGHSKGGGEAMFAALSAGANVGATVISPAHLHRRLLAELPSEALEHAHERIASYSPYGDPVPALRSPALDIVGIGTGYHFRGVPGAGPIALHDQPVRQLDHYIGGCPRALLEQPPPQAALSPQQPQPPFAAEAA